MTGQSRKHWSSEFLPAIGPVKGLIWAFILKRPVNNHIFCC